MGTECKELAELRARHKWATDHIQGINAALASAGFAGVDRASAVQRLAEARDKAEAENATLRAELELAEDGSHALCATCKHLEVREDMLPCLKCRNGHPSQWEPKPAPEPAKPTCAKCGRSDEAVAYVGERPTLCRPCYAEASRLAKLRERLESSSDDNAVKDTRGGGVAIVYYPLAVLDGRVRVRDNDGVMTWWNLADVTLLVPEGESHE